MADLAKDSENITILKKNCNEKITVSKQLKDSIQKSIDRIKSYRTMSCISKCEKAGINIELALIFNLVTSLTEISTSSNESELQVLDLLDDALHLACSESRKVLDDLGRSRIEEKCELVEKTK